jgi:hypothetical protein
LHSEELYNLYSSPDIARMIKSRRMRLAGRVASMEMINWYKIVIGNPEETPLGKPRYMWEYNIKRFLGK